MTLAARAAPPWSVTLEDTWLVVRLGGTHAVLSWAIAGGGRRRANRVAWRQVKDADLRPPIDAHAWLR